MIYNRQNIFTVVTADDIPQQVINNGIYGYFAHGIDSLKK